MLINKKESLSITAPPYCKTVNKKKLSSYQTLKREITHLQVGDVAAKYI